MNNQFNPEQNQPKRDTKKSSKTFKSKSKDSKVGEYIDYEEIE
ncbi:hypothetical protein ACFQ0R_10945 [Psychroflexus salinarum]|uniref:Uncharacterized protein n=1 Tax=Psychroflexus salinarum TaxID=546024 RepID=A0ABW3GR65_9FLAO